MRRKHMELTFPFKKALYIVKPALHIKLKSLSPIVLKPASPLDIPSHENPAIVMTCITHTHIHPHRHTDTAGERGVSSSPRLK